MTSGPPSRSGKNRLGAAAIVAEGGVETDDRPLTSGNAVGGLLVPGWRTSIGSERTQNGTQNVGPGRVLSGHGGSLRSLGDESDGWYDGARQGRTWPNNRTLVDPAPANGRRLRIAAPTAERGAVVERSVRRHDWGLPDGSAGKRGSAAGAAGVVSARSRIFTSFGGEPMLGGVSVIVDEPFPPAWLTCRARITRWRAYDPARTDRSAAPPTTCR